jgi:hypothetical protein
MASAEEIRAQIDSGWEAINTAPLGTIRDDLVACNSQEIRSTLSDLGLSIAAMQTRRGEIATMAEHASRAIDTGAATLMEAVTGSENPHATVIRLSSIKIDGNADMISTSIEGIDQQRRSKPVDEMLGHIAAIYLLLDETDRRTTHSIVQVDETLSDKAVIGQAIEAYKGEAL